MRGILLIAVVVTWFCVALVLASWAARRFKSPIVKLLGGIAVLLALLVGPLMDELIGKRQFDALCGERAVLKIDAQRAKGAKVQVVIQSSNVLLLGTAIPIRHSHLSYRTVVGDSEVASYDTYTASGGWFIRMLGISNANSPLTIGAPFCGPPNEGSLDKEYGFTLVNRIGKE
jgi:hypothetical protein